MNETPADTFSHATLPSIGKRVLRLGIAPTTTLSSDDISHAAERGASCWGWTFRKVTRPQPGSSLSRGSRACRRPWRPL
ncbi:MAG: hypothetical protein CSB49_05805 [Proteobacteria bacterium]|nr:MAG: hypothetical protein CSB49_05805 [Pseudomonadota bacterium]